MDAVVTTAVFGVMVRFVVRIEHLAREDEKRDRLPGARRRRQVLRGAGGARNVFALAARGA